MAGEARISLTARALVAIVLAAAVAGASGSVAVGSRLQQPQQSAAPGVVQIDQVGLEKRLTTLDLKVETLGSQYDKIDKKLDELIRRKR